MKYDIYFHNDFDGRAASAVVLAFLRSRGDDIEHYVPVKYDIIPKWIDDRFLEKNRLFKGKHNPAIVVDFPFHPQAAFWFDHHIRPFRKDGWEKLYKRDRTHRFDDSYRSACHLAYDTLKEGFGWKPPAHLRGLVKWLNVIDFADYKSAKQTIEMKEAAIQTNVFIEHTDDHATTVRTVNFLAERSLDDFVKQPDVKRKLVELKRDVAKSVQFHREHDELHGRAAFIDLTKDPTDDLAYFGSFYLNPKLLYCVRFHPFPGKPRLFHINVGANPWRRKENKKNIGELMKSYGGGGHKDVGGVELHGRAATERAAREMVEFLNKK